MLPFIITLLVFLVLFLFLYWFELSGLLAFSLETLAFLIRQVYQQSVLLFIWKRLFYLHSWSIVCLSCMFFVDRFLVSARGQRPSHGPCALTFSSVTCGFRSWCDCWRVSSVFSLLEIAELLGAYTHFSSMYRVFGHHPYLLVSFCLLFVVLPFRVLHGAPHCSGVLLIFCHGFILCSA